MEVARIKGFTRDLGAPANWNHERDGECGSLPVRDEMNGGMPCMKSAWKPTAEELEALNNGANVLLSVTGWVHPPVMVYVSGKGEA